MSRFCTNCGAQVDENARFCTNCGKVLEVIAPTVQPAVDENAPTGDPNWNPDTPEKQPIPAPAPQPMYQPMPPMPPKQKKSSKGLIIGLICGIAALIAVIVGAVVITANGKKINLDKYISVSFSGYEGYGNAYTTFDEEGFLKDNVKKFKKSGLMGQDAMALTFLASAEIYNSIDPTSGLKNGDTVHLTWTFDEQTKKLLETQYGIKVKCSDKDFTVEGLTEVSSFDPFANLQVTFSGNNGFGSVDMEQLDNPYRYDLSFETDTWDGLSNGDTITVTCELYNQEYFVEEYGVLPETTTKTYTVEGLTEIAEFDPFEYLEITYEGVSPAVDVSLDFKDDCPDAMYAFSLENWYFYDLANGDEFTVTFTSYYDEDQLAEYYGIKSGELSKTFKVEGQDAYISELSQISDEALKAMQTAAEAEIKDQAEDFSDDLKLKSAEYQGMYMLIPKNEDQYYNQNNYIFLVYKNTVTLDKEEAEYYTYVAFENMVVDKDGKCTVDTEDYDTTYSYVTYEGNTLYGYESLESFKSSCIEYNADYYNYVTDME